MGNATSTYARATLIFVDGRFHHVVDPTTQGRKITALVLQLKDTRMLRVSVEAAVQLLFLQAAQKSDVQIEDIGSVEDILHATFVACRVFTATGVNPWGWCRLSSEDKPTLYNAAHVIVGGSDNSALFGKSAHTALKWMHAAYMAAAAKEKQWKQADTIATIALCVHNAALADKVGALLSKVPHSL